MTTPDPRQRASALQLHGVLAHWSEVPTNPVAQSFAGLGGNRTGPPFAGAPAALCAYRTFQAAGRLRLGLARTV